MCQQGTRTPVNHSPCNVHAWNQLWILRHRVRRWPVSVFPQVPQNIMYFLAIYRMAQAVVQNTGPNAQGDHHKSDIILY